MTTQLTVTIDKNLISPGFILQPEQFNKKTKTLLNKLLADVKVKKNLVGPFKTGAEMDTYLDSI